MQFLYHAQAGLSTLTLSGEEFLHICIARRAKVGQSLGLRNLRDNRFYTYTIESISKKSAIITLDSSKLDSSAESAYQKSVCRTHIIWAITQIKTIEKSLPAFNELGLSKLSLFWADYSQGGQKISLERLEKILIQSCEQCGRSDICELEILPNTQAVLESYPDAFVLDFNAPSLSRTTLRLDSGAIIGAEGGFSQRERAMFENRIVLSLPSAHILRSQTAVMTLLAKAL